MKELKIITHDGKFHADEVCAIATLNILYPKIQIIRTRDESLFSSADFIVDIGRKFSPKKNYFDHHQLNFKEIRENGIPYASFGLIWKYFGKKLIENEKEFLEFDKKIVQFIDGYDSGSEIIKDNLQIFSLSRIIANFNPIIEKNENGDECFLKAVNFVKQILERTIEKYNLISESRKIIEEEIKKTKKNYLILPREGLNWEKTLLDYPHFKFVIFPTPVEWKSYGVFKNEFSFERRKDFPKNWAGLEKNELEKASGVKGAIFCHKKRFICTANSKEAIIELTKKAIGVKNED